MTTTTMAQPASVKHEWWVIDASNQVVGRLATQIATILRGKHRPEYTPHVDTGDFVVVVNASKLKFTGRKLETKEYQSYTGYPGGQKFASPRDMMARRPERILEIAVKGMLPKNRLSQRLFHNMHVYAGPNHPHAGQNPVQIEVKLK